MTEIRILNRLFKSRREIQYKKKLKSIIHSERGHWSEHVFKNVDIV